MEQTVTAPTTAQKPQDDDEAMFENSVEQIVEKITASLTTKADDGSEPKYEVHALVAALLRMAATMAAGVGMSPFELMGGLAQDGETAYKHQRREHMRKMMREFENAAERAMLASIPSDKLAQA